MNLPVRLGFFTLCYATALSVVSPSWGPIRAVLVGLLLALTVEAVALVIQQ